MKKHLRTVVGSFLFGTALGCVIGVSAAAPRTPDFQITEKIDTSSYELVGGSGPALMRGKVRITVEPVAIEPQKKMSVVFSDVGRGLNAGAGQSCVYKQEIPYHVRQLNVAFKILIENDMEQPLRTTKNGEDAILALQIGGKTVPKEQYPAVEHLKNLADWDELVILPGSSAELVYEGPFLDFLPSTATITLAIYDLTTETNDSGAVKKRSAFVWKYNYKKISEVRPGKIEYTCMCKTSGAVCVDNGGFCPAVMSDCINAEVDPRPRIDLMRKTVN